MFHEETSQTPIRYARRALGISQSELARRVGVGKRMVIWWEQGAHVPTRRKWPLIARALHRDESFFVDEYGDWRKEIG